MLILSRKAQEAIIIDSGRIVIRVLGVHGNQVRLGIETSKDVSIDREEIYERKVADGAIKPAT